MCECPPLSDGTPYHRVGCPEATVVEMSYKMRQLGVAQDEAMALASDPKATLTDILDAIAKAHKIMRED